MKLLVPILLTTMTTTCGVLISAANYHLPFGGFGWRIGSVDSPPPSPSPPTVTDYGRILSGPNEFRSNDNHGNYLFAYDESHETGGSSRLEEGTADGVRRGSYSLSDADGRRRTVAYVADHTGFHAIVRTNEPGVEPSDPADVYIQKEPFEGYLGASGQGYGAISEAAEGQGYGYGYGLEAAAAGQAHDRVPTDTRYSSRSSQIQPHSYQTTSAYGSNSPSSQQEPPYAVTPPTPFDCKQFTATSKLPVIS